MEDTWFQYHGATRHFVNETFLFWDEKFDGRVISKQ